MKQPTIKPHKLTDKANKTLHLTAISVLFEFGLPSRRGCALTFAQKMNAPVVYDKAKYHSDSVEAAGLPEGQEFVHTGFYLGWMIDNDLLDAEFVDDFLVDEVQDFKARKITGPQIYSRCDGALVDDMLNEEGNTFSKHYFDLEKGQFVGDYMRPFQLVEATIFSELRTIGRTTIRLGSFLIADTQSGSKPKTTSPGSSGNDPGEQAVLPNA